MVYVMLVLGSFTTYYLPTLSMKQGREAARLVENVLRTSLLIVVPLIATMMVLRPLMLTLLYSKEFLPAVGMMHWMLLGDFLKVVSFVVAMPMIAFADTRAFLAGEVGWNLLMVAGTSLVLLSGWSSEWLGAVFAASYLAYLLYAWFYCRRKTGVKLDQRLVITGIFACATLITVSWITWGETRVSIKAIVVAVVLSAVHVAICLRRGGSWMEPDLAYSRAS
jgi:O-antigen/teichoic acid export membrane protein